jgi:hypothetical protein
METLKLIVDVEAEDGMTRDAAIEAAVKEARASDEVLELAVQEIRPRYARYQKEANLWQVMAEVIEKEADFPPKGDAKEDAEADDLPKKIDDAVSEEEPKKEDAGDIKGLLMDFISQLQEFVDNLDGGDGPPLDKEPVIDLPPAGGEPVGPPKKKVGPPKPPMMANRRQARFLPKHAGARREVIASARELPSHDPELRGYRLARITENEEGTHYVATFTR